MSLMDEIQANRKRTGTECSVSVVAADLAPSDRADLHAALADPSVSVAAISRALKGRGVRLGVNSLGRHRRRDCHCEPTS